MSNTLLVHVAGLSSAEVIAGLEREVAGERAASARVLAWLAEVERRRLYLELGYSSLFAYCLGALGFSEDETCNRTGAVRAVLEYPQVLVMLEARTLTMTTARLLYPHLKGQPDPVAVLRWAAGRSRREVEVLIAKLSPQPDAPTVLRKVPCTPEPTRPTTSPASQVASLPAPRREVPAPLAPERFKLQVTLGGEAVEKLQLAQDMLSHLHPTGDVAAVLDRALDALLEELARAKFAATETPREAHGDPGSRHIPAAVRREVWIRDRGRCTFVGTDGHRCEERRLVQFDHAIPFCHGGPPTTGNVRLLCAAHNRHEARKDQARFTRSGTGEPGRPIACHP
jgi:5-methylcytosine-specific restriction endonuclease McrA